MRPLVVHCVRSCVALLLSDTCSAQVGVRWIVPQVENVTKSGLAEFYYTGLGVDFDITEYSSGGVDFSVIMDWNVPEGQIRRGTQGDMYYDHTRVYGLQYRSQFHFTDNGSGSAYAGSTIGLRYIQQKISEDPFGARNTGPFEQVNGVVFPLGLRIGFRGGLEELYGDIYAGVSYAIGGNRALSDAPFLAEESELSGVIFQIGCAVGLGN